MKKYSINNYMVIDIKSMLTPMKEKICFLVLFCTTCCPQISAQTFDMKGAIAPPEINTRFLENIHNSVNYQTGALNYSIRLFSLKVNDDLEIPINLTYSSNGIKESQSSGEVGVGWNLSINYRVTRTIYGRPDEYFSRPDLEEIGDSIISNTKYPRDRYLTKFTWGTSANGGMTLVSGQIEMDSEYDIFDYSTPTLSGSFVIENVASKNIRLAENLLTKFDFTNDATNGISSFTIKEPNGNIVVAGYDAQRGGYYSDYINTYLGKKSSYAWPVSRITTPDNKNVQFTYVRETVTDGRLSNERAITISEAYSPGTGYPSTTSIDGTTDGTGGAAPTYLTDSIISQYGKIKIYRSSSYQYIDSVALFDYAGKLLKKAIFNRSFSHEFFFLDSMKVVGKTTSQNENFSFEYYSRDVPRLVPDIWDNLRLPAGDEPPSDMKAYPTELGNEVYWPGQDLNPGPGPEYVRGPLGFYADRLPREAYTLSLKKVTLPTGGHNSFTYQSNSFYSYSTGLSTKGPGVRVFTSSAFDPVTNKTITHYYKYGASKNNMGGYGYIPIEIKPSHFGLYQIVLYLDAAYPYPFFLPGRLLTFSNSVIADNDPFFVRYNTVSYPVVVDSIENGGSTYYYYKSNKQGIWNPTRDFGNGLFSTYNLSEKPYLEKKEIYNNNGQRLQLEEYNYGMISDQALWGIKIKPYAFFADGYFTPADPIYIYGDGGSYSNGVSRNVSSIYDYTTYNIEFGLRILASKSITEFSGSDAIVSTTSYTYNNLGQVIKEVSTRSNESEELQTDYTYPNDFPTLSGTDNLTKDVIRMKELNMVNSWVERRFSKNTDNNGVITNTLLQSDFMTIYEGFNKPRAHYSVRFLNGEGNNFTPVNSTGGAINIDEKYEKSLSEILAIDTDNNPTALKSQEGVALAYIWDYNKLYPVAKVENSSGTDVAYTSFEADGKGNWSYTGTPVSDATAPTGQKSFTISNSTNNIAKAGLTATATYIVSYWKKSGTVTVNGTTPTATGEIVNGWTYYEHKIVNPVGGLITVSGSGGIIDELRLYPATAQMTTYTYDPLIGVTSQCDINNRITYYKYDDWGRLKTTLDQRRNVVKTMDYQYLKPYNQ